MISIPSPVAISRTTFLAVFEDWFAYSNQMQDKPAKMGLWGRAVGATIADGTLPDTAGLNVFCDALTPHLQREGWLGRMFCLFDIGKSNYLARRFAGQAHRTERCPVHGGVMSADLDHRCPHGCGLTGWLRAFPTYWQAGVSGAVRSDGLLLNCGNLRNGIDPGPEDRWVACATAGSSLLGPHPELREPSSGVAFGGLGTDLFTAIAFADARWPLLSPEKTA